MPAPVLTAVFNVTDSMGPIPGLYADGTNATANTMNLNSMIAELLTLGGVTDGKGGTLEFPSAGSASYAFDGPINIGTDSSGNTQPFSIILRGDGQQSRAIPLLLQTDTSSDFFVVNNQVPMDPTTNDNIGGIVFQDLMISYQVTDGLSDVGRGLVVSSGNVRVQRVTFDENPGIAIHFEGTLHSSVIDCDIRVHKVSGAVGMSVGSASSKTYGIEIFVTGTTLAAYSTNGTGLIINGAEHFRMANCRIEAWETGIVIQPASGTNAVRKVYFSNVSCYTSSQGLLINVSGGTETATQYVAQAWFDNCEFGPGGGSTTYDGAGIVIDSTDEYNVIDQVHFTSCQSCLWAGPGIVIQGGTNIEIIGGSYACNGNNGGGTPPLSYSLTGIAAVACTGLRIANPVCSNSFFNVYTQALASATQQYGVYVGGGTSNVKLNGCDLTGNTGSGLWVDGSVTTPDDVLVTACDMSGLTTPVTVSGTVPTLQIAGCPGYNGASTSALATSVPSGTFYAYQSGIGYYGPVIFFVGVSTTVTSIKINGITTDFKSGTFTLAPGQSGEVNLGAGTPPTFVMIGQ